MKSMPSSAFERAFGKTNDNADADTKITKFGIFISDLELQPSLHNWKNHQPVRKNILKSSGKESC